jgi:hypothetical protein
MPTGNIDNVHAETVYSSDEDDEIKISGKENNDRTTIIVNSYIDDQDANEDLQHSTSPVQESPGPRSPSLGRNSNRRAFDPAAAVPCPTKMISLNQSHILQRRKRAEPSVDQYLLDGRVEVHLKAL